MKVIIGGGGQIGSALAALLLAEGHAVTLIEKRPGMIEGLKNSLRGATVLEGSATDPLLLEAAGITSAHVVAAVTGADETNLVIAEMARMEFNVPRVIGRVNNPKNTWLFVPEMGVDAALDQAGLLAHLIAEEMSMGDMFTLLKLRKGQYSIVEEKVHPASVVVGRRIADLILPTECVLTAIIRQGELIVPHGGVELQAADEVIALVHSSHLSELAAQLGKA